jgi:uncharacterized protein YndB with AHSA1/START domain
VADERAFRALADADEVAAWLWPPRFGTQARTDPRRGGHFRFATTGEDAPEMAASGTYTEVDAPHRLQFSWTWDGDPAVTRVTVTVLPTQLQGAPGATVALHEEGFASAEARVNHQLGWEDCLDRLVQHLTSGRDGQ